MTRRRGVSLLDLVTPAGTEAVLPGKLIDALDKLTVVDHTSVVSDDAYVHHGVVQAAEDVGLPGPAATTLEVPGLNAGLQFRLMCKRVRPSAVQTVEPLPDRFLLDLLLTRVAVIVPGLEPAILVTAADAPPHLAEDSIRERVRLVGSATLRIAVRTDGDVAIGLIDTPDPFDPSAPTGATARFAFEPPHFFFGGSTFGMTVREVTVDMSDDYTPPSIVARSHDEAWQGVVIQEATLYLPRNIPLLGDVSLGVRDLIWGKPGGLQLDALLSFGRSTTNNTAVIDFLQDVNGSDALLPHSDESARAAVIKFADGTPATARIRARANLPADSFGLWNLPGGDSVSELVTPYFTARVGDIVRFTAFVVGDNGVEQTEELSFTFKDKVAGPPDQAPRIGVVLPSATSVTWSDVVHLSGSRDALAGLSFEASADDPKLRWQLGTGIAAVTGKGKTFKPKMPKESTVILTLTDGKNHQRRVQIDVLAEGPLLAGTSGGVFLASAPTAQVALRAVESTWDLSEFESTGKLERPAETAATLEAGVLDVPADALAQVSLELGGAEGPTAPPTPPVHIPVSQQRIRPAFAFDSPQVVGWVQEPSDAASDAVAASDFAGKIAAWADQFAGGTTFVVIGRCDDLPDGTPQGFAYNKTLANLRANAIATFLTGAGRTVYARGEQDTWDEHYSGTQRAEAIAAEDAAVTAGALVAADTTPGWLIRLREPASTLAALKKDVNKAPRPDYRRADIVAIPPTEIEDTDRPTDTSAHDPALRRALVQGPDIPEIKPPAKIDPDLPYAVNILVRWDSPTIVTAADAIPTLAEVRLSWQSEPLALPGTSETVELKKNPPAPTGPEIFTLVGRFAHDARSGQTEFSLALDSQGDPDGLASFDGTGTGKKLLALALGLAPAFLAGVGSASVAGDAVRIGALLAAAIGISAHAKNGKVTLHRVELEERQRGLTDLTGARQRIVVDYTVDIGFEVEAGGSTLKTDDHDGVKIRYKNVALVIDESRTGLDRVSLVFDEVSYEIENAGRWKVDGPIGELLRVVAVRAGAGSAWFEIELGVALDLGVITLSNPIIRLTFDAGSVSVELRGMQASVVITNVLEAHGAVALGDGGALGADLDVFVIPSGIRAAGTLAYDPASDYFLIGVSTEFPSAIPLLSTGLGIYGFKGWFVSNGKRLLAASIPDPVQREVEWFKTTPYQPAKGHWAIGLGAVIGTMPDGAFMFNGLGALAVEFPDPSVIFGVKAKVIAKRPPVKDKDATTANITGIVGFNPSAIMLGVRGTIEAKHLVRLDIPISGYFPLSGGGDGYLRIGSDGIASEGRAGDPVKLRLLPDTIDLKATGYLMVEQRKLHKLGGRADWNFDGFSVGFGAAMAIDWTKFGVGLKGSASLLAGIGTHPMMVVARLDVAGELDLVVASLSVTGFLGVTIMDDLKSIQGEICGEIDCWLFCIEGCIGFEIGPDHPGSTIPVPDHPVAGINLTDHRGVITGRAVTGGAAPTVWPDTVPVVHFNHTPLQQLDPGSAFAPSPQFPAPAWSGTTELKYAFRLRGVEIRKTGGAALPGPLKSCWWLPSDRPGVQTPNAPSPSSLEGRDLALLAWNPGVWGKHLGNQGGDVPGDPASTVGDVCNPSPEPVRNCVLGETAVRSSIDEVHLVTGEPGMPPFPSNFTIEAEESILDHDLETAMLLFADIGLDIVLGGVRALAAPFALPDHAPLTAAYQLTGVGRGTGPLVSAALHGRYSTPVIAPDLTLEVCQGIKDPGSRFCDRFADLTPNTQLPQPFAHGGIVYQSLEDKPLQAVDRYPRGARDNVAEIAFSIRGMRATFPYPVHTAIASVVNTTTDDVWLPLTMTAFDGNGNQVGRTTAPMNPGVLFTMTLSAAAIARIELAGASSCVLVELCHEMTDGSNALDQLVEPSKGREVPIVVGIDTGGKPREWEPKILDAASSPDGEKCRYVHYTAPDDGPWQAFQIASFPARVSLLSSCAITQDAQQAHDDDQQARNDFVIAWNAEAVSGESHPVVLDPSSTYEVRVRCDWQGWRPAFHGQTPGAPDPAAWTALPEQIYTFHTAAAPAALPEAAPTSFTDESTFDPRGLARYLIGFEPDGRGAPHFLDDVLRVHFEVDHLDKLLGKYGRTLTFKVRRTDPAPGSRSGGGDPTLPSTLSWHALPLALMELSDRRMFEAAVAVPCLVDDPLPGTGATADIAVDLEPDADYDLLVTASPLANPADDGVVIARCHFHTSRYRNPGELLAALEVATPAFPYAPHDMPVTALPTGVVLDDDRALDQALVTLGLDPWPLSDQPRTVLLWKLDGVWKLAGALVEAPEPIARTGRVESVAIKAGAMTLAPVRRNQAGTRALYLAAAPVALAPDAALAIQLVDKTQTATTIRSGARHLAGGLPRFVTEEVP